VRPVCILSGARLQRRKRVTETMNTINRTAELSENGMYRWWLRRTRRYDGNGVVCFVMLNPSTADSLQDDPTIRRCMRFAWDWGFAVLSVRNLFCLRATDPREIRRAGIDATGGTRGLSELMAAKTADMLVAAWGASVPFGRDVQALSMFQGTPVYCLGTTKNGNPRHPLYVRSSQRPILFR
jgi:hypothetical protein